MQAAADAPIACTLRQSALTERLDWIRRVTAESLVDHRLTGTTLHLSYRVEALADLEQIVAAERTCCAFLSYSLESTPDVARLTIVAPPEVGPEARWLFDQFLPLSPAAAPRACGCARGACG